MLKPEIAKKQLEQWQVATEEDDPAVEHALLARAAKLPKPLLTIAYALFDRDADGKEFPFKNWQETQTRQTKACAELDKWKASQRLRLFESFFPKLGEHVERAWQFLKATPYTHGYTRKAFRAPNHAATTLPKRHAWLASLLVLAGQYQSEVFTPSWLACWAPHLGESWRNPQDEIGQLLAAVIDAGGPLADEVFDILAQSLRNEHEIGGMGRHVTRALLLSSRADGWELMEKTLLAAQRQEGLRQTILETIDEAHPQAFRRMLRLIQEHDLARFSAVVRAVNVWFGFGWDSVSTGTVNAAIDRALRFLDDETARQRALDGKVAEDAFLALWSIAFEDAHAAIPAAAKLLKHAKVEHRYVAAAHLCQLGLTDGQAPRLDALDDADLRVAWCALGGLNLSEDEGEDEDGELLDTGKDLFARLERLYQRVPEKPTDTKPLVWPWTAMRLDRRVVTAQMLGALGDRPPTQLLPYLPAFHPYHRAQIVGYLAEQKKWDRLTRDSLLDLAGDSGSEVRKASYEALAKQPLQRGEAERLEGYLTRKTSDLRRGVIGLLAKQKDVDALASADRLLAAKDAQQRLAGLELLRQLAEADRQRKRCQERAVTYRASRTQFTKEEETQLSAIQESGRERITLDNALGLMNPAERSPIVPPKKHKVPFITDAAIACLKGLDELVHQERETTVCHEFDGRRVEELLGTSEYGFPSPDWKILPGQCKDRFLLRDLWEKWHDGRAKGLRDPDGLELMRALIWVDEVDEYDHRQWRHWTNRSREHREVGRALSGGHDFIKLRYKRVVRDVIEWLVYLHPPKNAIDVLLDALETAFALVPARLHERLAELAVEDFDDDDDDDDASEPDWREQKPFEIWINALTRSLDLWCCRPAGQQLSRYWQLLHWCDQPIPAARRHRPDLSVLMRAYAAGAATEADWYDQLLGPQYPSRYRGISFDDLRWITDPDRKEYQDYFKDHSEIRALLDRCRERILEVELDRGEEATVATLPALHLESLYGADTLLRILTALGKQGFKVESHGSAERRVGRPTTFTHLAGITYPKPTDTPADFSAKMKEAIAGGHIPEERVLELAFHAPQWSRFIETYLYWPGFSEGLYWLLAHMKYIGDIGSQAAAGAGVAQEEDSDDDSRDKPSAWDRLIGERTPLTAEERQEGAVDVQWFQKTYAQLSPKRWEAMARAARYAANAAQAKRAQFIADVLLGKAGRRDLIAGIRKKFLKENVRLLALLPLAAGAKRDADIAERYRVLQEYRRYAKQLSAMTKESALRAAEIGMQNLARTAGYPDPLRLEWSMEADSVKDLARGPVSAKRDDITVTLSLDECARPQLTVSRNGKELKSIPPEIKKKDKNIASLAERVTELKRQSPRMRQSLELAMCRGDAITAAELLQLSHHALLAPLLNRLVLVGDGILGYPDKGGKALRDHRGKLEPIKKTETLRIAHPHDLLATGHWDAWQHECFRAERVQPFKQVFRELYIVTKQEKSDGTLSRRYAGQQVNPTQAYALWGQRGWNVKEGVWRTFYDVGITAFVGFNFGITTPLEVEGLTIETVQFEKRDAAGPMKLAAVPPRIFSEVMRDLNLVVSVAHRGEVDPEASASTVEMRGNLLREASQLLQVKNVRVKDNYALVDGELGKYSIHLGSAVVHKLPGGALCIVPVHAQHRGRLFLPFADDDPKTAEVISKVLLLARDAEIQDPVILDQLRHRGV
jgi:hypothetical protein